MIATLLLLILVIVIWICGCFTLFKYTMKNYDLPMIVIISFICNLLIQYMIYLVALVSFIVGVVTIISRIRSEVDKQIIRLQIGKDGYRYKENTRYLKFDKKGNFYFEVRDRRFCNTFLIDKNGIIKEIYFPIDNSTFLSVGDKIDISDRRNIYLVGETLWEMNKYEKTRKFIDNVY